MNKVQLIFCLMLALPYFTGPITHAQNHVQKKSPKPAFVMLALNYGAQEIDAVKRAAEARGEQFILIPKMTEERIRIGQFALDTEVLESRKLPILNENIVRAGKLPPNATLKDKEAAQARQKAAIDELLSASAKLSERKNQLVTLRENAHYDEVSNKDLLIATFKDLERRKITVSGFAMSSHYSGEFKGTFGKLQFSDLSEVARACPKTKESLRSVYLLGCYGTTSQKPTKWRKDFPNLELVGGWDVQSPLRDAPKAWHYIGGLMALEHKLTQQNDAKKIEAMAQTITDINKTGAAFATFPKCTDPSQQKEFYRGKIYNYQTTEFDLKFCKEALPDFEKNALIYQKYVSGELPLPSNTGHSELRDLYTFYRTHEVCYEAGIATGPPVEEVMFLVFHEKVRANFSRFIATDLKYLTERFARVDPQQLYLIENDKLAKLTVKSKSEGGLNPVEKEELKRLQSPERTLAQYRKELSLLTESLKPLQDEQSLRKMSMGELTAMGEKIEVLSRTQNFPAHFESSVGSVYRRIAQIIEKNLIKRKCLPYSWHEDPAQKIDEPHCAPSTPD